MTPDWDERYREEDTPWDKGAPSPPLAEFLENHRIEGSVLVPGCGLGHDVRLIAACGGDVLGMDISETAVERAANRDPVGGESYRFGDFLNLRDELRGSFDWVVEHSCLCALDPGLWPRYADAVAAALKPLGSYLAIFYRIVEGFDGEGPPWPISADEIAALFDDRFEVLKRSVPRKSYDTRPYGNEEVVLMRKR